MSTTPGIASVQSASTRSSACSGSSTRIRHTQCAAGGHELDVLHVTCVDEVRRRAVTVPLDDEAIPLQPFDRHAVERTPSTPWLTAAAGVSSKRLRRCPKSECDHAAWRLDADLGYVVAMRLASSALMTSWGLVLCFVVAGACDYSDNRRTPRKELGDGGAAGAPQGGRAAGGDSASGDSAGGDGSLSDAGGAAGSIDGGGGGDASSAGAFGQAGADTGDAGSGGVDPEPGVACSDLERAFRRRWSATGDGNRRAADGWRRGGRRPDGQARW